METFLIPLIYKQNKYDAGTRVLLPIENLLFIRVIGKLLYFYGIHNKEYVLQASLADWRILLRDLEFEEIDRGMIVNIRKISYIYRDLQQVHFGADAEGVFTIISQSNIPRIHRLYPHIPIYMSGSM